MPKLSIIVTAYNVAPYLRACLDGLLGQTLEDIEVIVVDDGSTDETPGIIAEAARSDARVRAIRLPENTPGGVGPAANAGLAAARGTFIGFADGDDLYDRTMFARLHAAACAHDADLAICRYQLLDDRSGALSEPEEAPVWRAFPETTALTLDVEARRALLRLIAVPWRKIYRRDLVERVGLRFPEGDFFFEDNPVHWAAILGARRAVMLPERLCRHRIGRAGQTMETADHRLPQIFCHHDTIRGMLRDGGVEEVYRQDLLLWLARQMGWVCARAEGDVLRAVFDALVPIVAQYDSGDIAAFCAEAAPFRTAPLFRAVQRRDFESFARAAAALRARAVSAGAAPAAPRGTSLWAVGLYHLRHSGLRRTAGLTARFLADRLGLVRGAQRKEGPGMADQKDVMMALAVLSRDVRALRAEVAALRQELGSRSDSIGGAEGTEAPVAVVETPPARPGSETR